MVKVKICGITTEEEINYLNELKPDYAGFVFAESKRKIDVNRAGILSSRLSSNIKSVGVFRNQSISDITKILDKVNVNVIQLHGNEDIKYIEMLRKYINEEIEIWKSISINNIKTRDMLLDQIYEYKNRTNRRRTLVDKYLIDGINPGSGQEYSLKELNDTIRYIPDDFKFLLAGGITPENVSEKIKEVNPFGIDVSSGVEYIDENGLRRKSYEKIKMLINKVKS